MRFREPLLACGWRGDERGESRRPGHGGAGGFRSLEPGGDLSEVPAVWANYLAGASAARERERETHLASEHLFLHRVSPFPNTAELVVACFGNAEAGAHTSGWERGREQAPPHPPSHTSKKKKKSPQCSLSGSLQILRRPVFTDLNDLGGKDLGF